MPLTIIKTEYKKQINLFEIESTQEHRIVLLGDSIMNYFETEKYYQNTNIINKGIPGDTTVGVLRRIDQIVKLKPNLVILNIGLNDLLVTSEPKADKIVKQILKIKYHLESEIKGVKVHLVSLTPVYKNNKDSRFIYLDDYDNSLIDQINEQLLMFTNLIDVNSFLKNEACNLKNEYTIDGVHLNDEGYYVFSQILADEIEELILKKQKEK